MNWINVKYRLPDESEEQKVLFQINIVGVDYYKIGRYLNGSFEWWNDKYELWEKEDITYWCEVTPPPLY